MHYDDNPEEYLARLRPLVRLECPDCPAVVTGQGRGHAVELLAIHWEGTCQRGGEVSGDGSSNGSAPASHPDVLLLTPEPPAGAPPVPGRD